MEGDGEEEGNFRRGWTGGGGGGDDVGVAGALPDRVVCRLRRVLEPLIGEADIVYADGSVGLRREALRGVGKKILVT